MILTTHTEYLASNTCVCFHTHLTAFFPRQIEAYVNLRRLMSSHLSLDLGRRRNVYTPGGKIQLGRDAVLPVAYKITVETAAKQRKNEGSARRESLEPKGVH